MTPVQALDTVLRDATRVRVGKPGAAGALLETGAATELALLRTALAVTELTGTWCMCHGDLTFEFFDRGGRGVASVGFHHPGSVRWSGWEGDAALRDGGRVLGWLARHDVGGPPGWDARPPAVRAAHQRTKDEWRAAAPAAVQDLLALATAADLPPRGVHLLVARRLTEAFPDPVRRAAALLVWYGSGTGRCTDYPPYEALPEPALAEIPIARLIDALRADPPDARLEAGAVRHLFGVKSRPQQARDIARLPADLRARLLASARDSGDEDKRARAQRWLGAAAKPRKPH